MKKNTIVIRFDSIRFDSIFYAFLTRRGGYRAAAWRRLSPANAASPPSACPLGDTMGGLLLGGSCWRLLAVMAAWGLMAAFGGSADGWGSAGPTGPWSRRAGTGAAMPERAQGLRHGGFGGH